MSAYPQAIAKRFSTRAHLEMCKQGEHASRLFREWLLSAQPPLPTGVMPMYPQNLQSPTAHFVVSAALDGGTVEHSLTFDLDSVCGGGGVRTEVCTLWLWLRCSVLLRFGAMEIGFARIEQAGSAGVAMIPVFGSLRRHGDQRDVRIVGTLRKPGNEGVVPEFVNPGAVLDDLGVAVDGKICFFCFLHREMHGGAVFNFMDFGGVLRGDQPDPATRFEFDDGHGPGAELAGVGAAGDEHSRSE